MKKWIKGVKMEEEKKNKTFEEKLKKIQMRKWMRQKTKGAFGKPKWKREKKDYKIKFKIFDEEEPKTGLLDRLKKLFKRKGE